MMPGHLTKIKHQNTIGLFWFIVGISVYFSLVINAPFSHDAFLFIRAKESLPVTLGLTSIVILFLISIFISLFSLLCIRFLTKSVCIGMLLIGSMLSYAYFYYGLQFDDYSPMVGVIEQTNLHEIKSYITLSSIGWVSITGLLPALLILRIKLRYPPFWQEMICKLLGVLIYPLFYFALVFPFWLNVQPMLRLSGLAARLPYQIIPTNFAENAFNFYKLKMTADLPYQKMGLDAEYHPRHLQDAQNKLLVIVIGETARSANFQWNGYQRATNPYTHQQSNLVSFQHATACATATRVSVPCMFSHAGHNQFQTLMAMHQDNLLDILKRVGFHVLWFDNNGPGDCQGVCQHVETAIVHGFDGMFIDTLKEKLRSSQRQDTIIVFHLQGSHGNDYYAKYPETFARFQPECKRDEIRFCEKASLLNAYDNSILYTDYVLNQIIEILKQENAHWRSMLIYTSDHGESIGEHGVYGHCAPFLIAPAKQKEIPFLIWLSPQVISENQISWSCLKDEAQHKNISHDYFFHSILGLMGVGTSLYQPSLDVFSSCRVNEKLGYVS